MFDPARLKAWRFDAVEVPLNAFVPLIRCHGDSLAVRPTCDESVSAAPQARALIVKPAAA